MHYIGITFYRSLNNYLYLLKFYKILQNMIFIMSIIVIFASNLNYSVK